MKAIVLAFAVVLIVSALPLMAVAESDEIVVVVNKANPQNEVGRDELRLMFQTVKTNWGDGTRAAPVNLPDDDPVRQRFDAVVLGLDPDRVLRYWIDRKVRGGERPPPKVSSETAVLRVVGATRGGVGYVKASAFDQSVKIVARIRDGQVVGP